MPEYQKTTDGDWIRKRNWKTVCEELKELHDNGADCSPFTVRTNLPKGDEARADEHPKTRQLFAPTLETSGPWIARIASADGAADTRAFEGDSTPSDASARAGGERPPSLQEFEQFPHTYESRQPLNARHEHELPEDVARDEKVLEWGDLEEAPGQFPAGRLSPAGEAHRRDELEKKDLSGLIGVQGRTPKDDRYSRMAGKEAALNVIEGARQLQETSADEDAHDRFPANPEPQTTPVNPQRGRRKRWVTFCATCGSEMELDASCQVCGTRVDSTVDSKKSAIVAIVLCLAAYLGVGGLHRFYVGKIGTGILMLVTMGGFGVWALIDLVIIVVGRFRDSDDHLMKMTKSSLGIFAVIVVVCSLFLISMGLD